MVALLFRTLDAFRIFDTIFIMTNGANGTECCRSWPTGQTIARLEIGLGSAVSVLLFLCVVLMPSGSSSCSRSTCRQARGGSLPDVAPRSQGLVVGR